MPELTLEEALDTASEWTDEEIEWIYSVGGSVYGDVERETDRQSESIADKIRAGWDAAWEWGEKGLSWLADKLNTGYDAAEEWLREQQNKLSWGEALLIGDIASETELEAWREAAKAAILIGDVGGWTQSWTDEAAEAAKNAGQAAATWIDERFGDITINLDLGFEWLAERLKDLLEIPATAFFRYLALIMTPPGAGES